MPRVIIIGGPNGAGKTTASRRLLLEVDHCIEFVNADEIARGLSPFNVDSVALQAGKLMLNRMHELRDAQRDFAFETTMASRSFAPFLRDCRRRGYTVEAYFFVVDSPEYSINRVRQRVALGGHNVPEDIIRRRFWAGIANFVHLYIPLSDSWMCYNSVDTPPRGVASYDKLRGIEIEDDVIWKRLQNIANGIKE